MSISTFDTAAYLDSPEMIAAYINDAIEEGDEAALMLALNNVIRARGVAQVAADAGLARESLYKTLAPGSHPRFETIQKLLRALDLNFKVAHTV